MSTLVHTFRPVRDHHKVLAVLDDGTTRQIGLRCDWLSAQARWDALDEARRAGLLRGVQYLAVRHETDPDPRWANAPVSHGEIVALVDGYRPPEGGQAIRNEHGYASREAAARAFARWSGRYTGAPGGWIYRRDGADRTHLTPITQGWWAFATALRNQGRLVERGGQWFVADPKLTDVFR